MGLKFISQSEHSLQERRCRINDLLWIDVVLLTELVGQLLTGILVSGLECLNVLLVLCIWPNVVCLQEVESVLDRISHFNHFPI